MSEAKQATPHAELIAQLLDSRVPKSEREHAASREIERLRAEVAGLREDAERYRILRRGQRWSVINGIGDTLRAEQLDAAIDAARKGEAC